MHLCRLSARLCIATSTKIKKRVYWHKIFFFFFLLLNSFSRSAREKGRPRPLLSQASKYVRFSEGYQLWNSSKIHILIAREVKKKENAWQTISLRWAAERLELEALNRATPWETDLRRTDTFFFPFPFFCFVYIFSSVAVQTIEALEWATTFGGAAKVHAYVPASVDCREANEKKRWANKFLLSCRLRSICVHFSEAKRRGAHSQWPSIYVRTKLLNLKSECVCCVVPVLKMLYQIYH